MTLSARDQLRADLLAARRRELESGHGLPAPSHLTPAQRASWRVGVPLLWSCWADVKMLVKLRRYLSADQITELERVLGTWEDRRIEELVEARRTIHGLMNRLSAELERARRPFN